MHRLVCVGPGRKPQRAVFLYCGSYVLACNISVPNGRLSDDIMDNMKDSLPDKDFNGAKTLPPETQAPPTRVVTSQGSRSASATVTQSKVLVRIPVFYYSILGF